MVGHATVSHKVTENGQNTHETRKIRRTLVLFRLLMSGLPFKAQDEGRYILYPILCSMLYALCDTYVATQTTMDVLKTHR
jgi:hypothetical protein